MLGCRTMLFVTPAATAIAEALASAHATEGTIVVVGDAKLATALESEREHCDNVIAIGVPPRQAKKLKNVREDLTGIAPQSLAAVIGVDVASDDNWAEHLRAWSQLVRDGGVIAFVDRGHAPEASRRALCAGLSELEQRHAGRNVITSGLVTHL
jgi:hypothetical protein